MTIPTIKINLDAECSECGEKGATQSGLCLKCVAKKILKGGIMGAEIKLALVEELSITMKKGKVRISFETMMTPAETARLLNFSRQGRPMSAYISSPQATMDLRIEEIDLATGVLAAN